MSYGTVQAEKMTTESGYSLGAGNASSFKNRIINGGMVFDQRNSGASVTPINSQYLVDRFWYNTTQTSKVTAQQSTVAPTGFVNSLLITSTSAYSVGAGDVFGVSQIIEGNNIADLAWGTANAKTVTLSFWVRSSLTGTFGGSFYNSAANRAYPFSYTISTANTWEQKSITVAGDTTGTWLTTNGVGITVYFCLGTGSFYGGTADAWTSSIKLGITGQTSLVGTSGATWQVTGVQLEVGTVATSFDYRPYGTELALCQRYYEKSYDVGTAPATSTNLGNTFCIGRITAASTLDYCTTIQYKVPKRATPSLSFWTSNGTANIWDALGGTELPKLNASNSMSFSTYLTAQSGLTVGQAGYMYGQWASSSEL
jgi:hypothetical protein